MSTEYLPYPAYYAPPQQFGANPGAAAQSAYYREGIYPTQPPTGAYTVPPPAATAPGANPTQQSTPFFNFSNDRFLKGLLIGAAAAYLLTNESVQRTAIKGAVKAWSLVHGGVEEVKERFHDAEAELHAAEAAKEEAHNTDDGGNG